MTRSLEDHFSQFAENVVGQDYTIQTVNGPQELIYADWAASGRLYGPVEQKLQNTFGPMVANTHTETNATGEAMTSSYHKARQIIKEHFTGQKTDDGESDDVLIMAGSGMTGALAHFQRILGFHVPERFADQIHVKENDRPIVFISRGEHHSNDISWREAKRAGVDVELIPYDLHSITALDGLERFLDIYRHRTTKIAAVTTASNVTGIRPPIYDIARMMHAEGGYIIVDATCAAPYDDITMHRSKEERLDAMVLSPHKLLGGPGSAGVVIFDKQFYNLQAPVHPGGGTVMWTNPWDKRGYIPNIEDREDGGTPPFLQTIKAALAVALKEQMGVLNIAQREKEIGQQVFSELRGVTGVHILAGEQEDRLPVFALDFPKLHYNAVVRLLNDRFGVQVRGGCSCAGTLGHELFNINEKESNEITCAIDAGDLSRKPGFVRASFHPTMSSERVGIVTDAIRQVAKHGQRWSTEYVYDKRTNEFHHPNAPTTFDVDAAFKL